MKKLAQQPEMIAELVKKANEDFSKQRPDNGRAIQDYRKRIGEFEKKLAQITDQILEADTKDDKAMWMDKARQCRSQKDELELELKTLVQEGETHRDAALDPDSITRAISRFTDEFDALPVATKRALLTSFLERVVVYKDRLKLVVRGPQPLALESFGKSQLEGCYPGGPKFGAL